MINTNSKQFLKTYYYDVIHWQIKLYVSYVRNKSYPEQERYWKQTLQSSLIERNEYALIIINFIEPVNNEQLSLF
jgi:hypothetical protein